MDHPSKRIFICCDGTRNDCIRDQNDMITNVARFARCLKPYGDDGKLQLIYYHEGIGTLDGEKQKWDSVTGQSIHGDIQDAYHFLCLNYQPGDEIHLVGFSRGAFAVRSLACFIDDFGILTAPRLATLKMVYDLWKDQRTAALENCSEVWVKEGWLLQNIPIKTCAVWDTVRSLYAWPKLSLPTQDTLAFVEDKVPVTLDYAFQALALHETRTDFKPVMWGRAQGCNTVIRQTWFAGDHSDIGGGHADSGLATISLLWMLSQFRETTTGIGIHEVMVLDYMTPLYLIHDKLELLLVPHSFTTGRVHGKKDWPKRTPYRWSATSRLDMLTTVPLDKDPPHLPSNVKGLPDEKELGISQLMGDGKSKMSSVRSLERPHNSTGRNEQRVPKAQTTVHHTVRLLKTKRNVECLLLAELEIRLDHRNGGVIRWTNRSQTRAIWEDMPTIWEKFMHDEWIKRENEVYSKLDMSPAPNSLADITRFTTFLAKYRFDSVHKHLKTGFMRTEVASDHQQRTRDRVSRDEREPTRDLSRPKSAIGLGRTPEDTRDRTSPPVSSQRSRSSEPYSVVSADPNRKDSIMTHPIRRGETQRQQFDKSRPFYGRKLQINPVVQAQLAARPRRQESVSSSEYYSTASGDSQSEDETLVDHDMKRSHARKNDERLSEKKGRVSQEDIAKAHGQVPKKHARKDLAPRGRRHAVRRGRGRGQGEHT